MEIFTLYYGVDMLAMIMTFWSIYAIGDKKDYGFLIGIVGNILWMAFGIMTTGVAIIIANIIIASLNARAYWNWEHEPA